MSDPTSHSASLQYGLSFSSLQAAYVHAIRRARRFLYVENQYFLGSSHAWLEDRLTGEILQPLARYQTIPILQISVHICQAKENLQVSLVVCRGLVVAQEACESFLPDACMEKFAISEFEQAGTRCSEDLAVDVRTNRCDYS